MIQNQTIAVIINTIIISEKVIFILFQNFKNKSDWVSLNAQQHQYWFIEIKFSIQREKVWIPFQIVFASVFGFFIKIQLVVFNKPYDESHIFWYYVNIVESVFIFERASFSKNFFSKLIEIVNKFHSLWVIVFDL